MSHTPGPWKYNGKDAVVSDVADGWLWGANDDRNYEWYGGYLICESVTPSNARLIAAAPELLAACEMARAWIVGYAEFAGVVAGLGAAIAKAKGEIANVEPN